jgi:hypothetical protein
VSNSGRLIRSWTRKWSKPSTGQFWLVEQIQELMASCEFIWWSLQMWILANGEATVCAGGGDQPIARPDKWTTTSSRRHVACIARASGNQNARRCPRESGVGCEGSMPELAATRRNWMCTADVSPRPTFASRCVSRWDTRAGGGPSSPGTLNLELCSAGVMATVSSMARWVNASAVGEELGSDGANAAFGRQGAAALYHRRQS